MKATIKSINGVSISSEEKAYIRALIKMGQKPGESMKIKSQVWKLISVDGNIYTYQLTKKQIDKSVFEWDGNGRIYNPVVAKKYEYKVEVA